MKMEKCAPNAPDRCQGIRPTFGDQCPYQANEGTKWCTIHGTRANFELKQKAKRVYNLTKYRARVDSMGEEYSLVEEIGLLRVTLEELVNHSEGIQLVNNSSKLTALVKEIRETISVDKKMKSIAGEYLDRKVLDKICDGMVDLISEHVAPDKLLQIVDKLGDVIGEAVAIQ